MPSAVDHMYMLIKYGVVGGASKIIIDLKSISARIIGPYKCMTSMPFLMVFK